MSQIKVIKKNKLDERIGLPATVADVSQSPFNRNAVRATVENWVTNWGARREAEKRRSFESLRQKFREAD